MRIPGTLADAVWDPISTGLAVASIGTGIVGGIASANASKQQLQNQAAMYTYQAGIADQNQKLAQQNATFALIGGEQSAAQEGMRTRQQVGAIRAAQSASGLDINKGSAPRVAQSQQDVGALEQATIRGNSAKAAYDYDVQGWQYGQQASLYRQAAANSTAAEPLSYEASILGTASNVASKWLSFSQSGALPGVGKIGSAITDATGSILGPTIASVGAL